MHGWHVAKRRTSCVSRCTRGINSLGTHCWRCWLHLPCFTASTYIFLSKCVPVDNSDIFFARIGDDEFGIIYIARAPQLWRKRQRCRGGNRVGDRLCRGSHGRYSCSLCRRSGSHRRCCPFNIKKTRDHHENNKEKASCVSMLCIHHAWHCDPKRCTTFYSQTRSRTPAPPTNILAKFNSKMQTKRYIFLVALLFFFVHSLLHAGKPLTAMSLMCGTDAAQSDADLYRSTPSMHDTG